MAHYRFTLFVITCMTCLGSVPSVGQGAGDLVGRQKLAASNQSPLDKLVKSTQSGTGLNGQREGQYALALGSTLWRRQPSDTRSLTVVADIPSDKGTPVSQASPESKKKDSKASANKVKSLARSLLRHKSLLILTLAVLVITGAAVFILLKLVSTDEPGTSRKKPSLPVQGNSSVQRTPTHQTLEANFPPDPLETEAAWQGNNPFDPSAYSVAQGNRYPSDNPPNLLVDPDPELEKRTITDPESNLNPPYSEGYNNGFNESALTIPDKNSPATSLGKNSASPPSQPSLLSHLSLIDQLIQDLQHPNPITRRKAIWELGQRGDSRAVEPLVKLLADSDSKQHSLILASLSEIGIRLLKPVNRALSISLQNEKADVRKNAIRDLIRIYELIIQILPLLQRAADDSDVEVQETARWALSQFHQNRSRLGKDNLSGWQNFGGED